MTRSEIGKLMEGIAKAKAADDGSGLRNATAALAPLIAEVTAQTRAAVYAIKHRAQQASGNDNAR